MTVERTISKRLAGDEDFALGEGTETQSRNGQDVTITQVRRIQPVNSLEELNALDTSRYIKACLFNATTDTFHLYEFSGGTWNLLKSADVDPAGSLALETKELASGQVAVTFTNPTDAAAFHVSGPDVDNTRLFAGKDYSVNHSTKTITLFNSYPAGTNITSMFYELIGSNLGTASTLDFGRGDDQVPRNSDLVKKSMVELKATTGLTAGDVVYLSTGDNSGQFEHLVGDYSVEVAADTREDVYVTLNSDPEGLTGVLKRKVVGHIFLSSFGGVADFNRTTRTGTDNQLTLDAAEQFCYDNNLKLIIDGDYGVASATVARPIVRHGIGKANSGLFALADNHRVYTMDGTYTSGTSVMYDFTIKGYAQSNTTQGGDTSALVEIDKMDYAFFIEMECCWGRQMAVKSRARVSWADKCHIHHMLRDGINLTDSKIRIMTNNVCEYIADDPLCAHSNTSNPNPTTTIMGNTLFNTYGIKCLSGRFTIADNHGDMIFGYGVQFGQASGFSEGDIDVVSSSVTGNSFTNIINTSKIGGGDLGVGIFSRPIFTANANGYFPGDYDKTANVFVDPLATVDQYGSNIAHTGLLGVTIADNDIIQTWTGGATISDYGKGEAWTTSGFQDIALSGTLAKDGNKVWTHQFNNVAENVECNPGTTYGTQGVYLFNNTKRIRNFDGTIGQAARIYDKGISITKDASISVLNCENAIIDGGTLDMDPMHEHPDREYVSGEPTGAWTNTGSLNCNSIFAPNVRGFVWRNTMIRNVQRLATVSGGGLITPIIRDLIIYRGEGTGVGSVQNELDQFRIYTDCDPRSATYGEILQGNLSPRSSLPSADSYFSGQRIKNSDYSATIGGNNFVEMVRITNGNSHVLGTDWKILQLS